MIKFVWDLCYFCNFSCEYCFPVLSGQKKLLTAPIQPKSAKVIEDAWAEIYRAYGASCIFISGGEPFLYPDFTEVICRISKLHKIHITTNLSQHLDVFISKNSPERVELNSSFHPMFMEVREFSGQVTRLKNAGFTCGVCYLAHPAQLREMVNYQKYFKSLDISMAVTQFRGTYCGKKYPESYTPEEKEYMDYVSKYPAPFDIRHRHKKRTGKKESTEEQAHDEMKLTPCLSGYKSVIVLENGDIKMCPELPDITLGNIFDKSAGLFSQKYICDVQNCPDPV